MLHKIVNPKDTILLAIAHPDDEALFFTPTISYFKRFLLNFEKQFFVYCATNGDADGHGPTRVQELQTSLKYGFNLPPKQIIIRNNSLFKDGHTAVWNLETLRIDLRTVIHALNVNYIITFDGQGVSNHPNHINVGNCCAALAIEASEGKSFFKGCFRLKTHGLIAKYYFPILFILLIWNMIKEQTSLSNKKQSVCRTVLWSQFTAMQNFRKHKSQIRWYRTLMGFFSSYSWLNEMVFTKAEK